MNRIILPIATFALAAASLQAAGTDPNIDYNVLQGRIASLETKVKTLESALRELTSKVAEPSPTNTSAPVANITPPAPPAPAPTPAVKPPVVPAVQPEVKKHVIGANETVSVIANKYQVPRAELMEANGLREGQQIYIGDELIIPQPKPAVAKTTPSTDPAKVTPTPVKDSGTTPAPAQTLTYKVKSGDTLSKIARAHGTTVAAIKSGNNLSTDNLSIGQSLKIPAKGAAAPPANQIAAKPAATPAPQQANKQSASATGTQNVNHLLRQDEVYGVYTVEKGDTLYSLARDFFTTQAELQRLNEMGNSTVLRPGQDVVVPTKKYSEHHNLAKNG
jgi:LysM repeat protein